MKYRNIFFDLDGTLADYREYYSVKGIFENELTE